MLLVGLAVPAGRTRANLAAMHTDSGGGARAPHGLRRDHGRCTHTGVPSGRFHPLGQLGSGWRSTSGGPLPPTGQNGAELPTGTGKPAPTHLRTLEFGANLIRNG